jgi:hypothetical protein
VVFHRDSLVATTKQSRAPVLELGQKAAQKIIAERTVEEVCKFVLLRLAFLYLDHLDAMLFAPISAGAEIKPAPLSTRTCFRKASLSFKFLHHSNRACNLRSRVDYFEVAGYAGLVWIGWFHKKNDAVVQLIMQLLSSTSRRTVSN